MIFQATSRDLTYTSNNPRTRFQDTKKKKSKSSSSESASSPRFEFTAHFKACVASAREDVSKRRKDALIARLGGTAVTSLARYAGYTANRL